MSLLLQALQKASRHRESGGGAHAEAGAPVREPAMGEPGLSEAGLFEPGLGNSSFGARPPSEPTLSDLSDGASDPPLSLADADSLFAPEAEAVPEAPRQPEPPAPPLRPVERPVLRPASASGGSAQAATILRANETRSTGMLDWVRDRPVHATLSFALVFGVFYGIYLYLAISHPGVLRGEFPWSSQPRKSASKRPPPPPNPAPQSTAISVNPSPSTGPVATAPLGPGTQAPLTVPQASGQQPAEKPLAGMPQPLAPQGKPKPAARATQQENDPFDEAAPRATRRTAPRTRAATVDVEASPLEDSVAVRPPPAAPAAPGQTLMRAWEALQQGRHDEARKLYQEVLQADGQSVDALLGLAALAARNGNTEEAARAYARALEIEPRNGTAQAGLISIIGQADPPQSETRLKQLIAREPSAFLYFALGNLYARQNLWPQAQPAFFQAYESQPDNPDYAYNLAVGLEHLGQPKIALNYYRRALELSTLKGHAGFDQARVRERIEQLTARVGSGQ